MKVIISRTYNSSETQGAFIVMEGHRRLFECVCLELPDKNNEHNISCIQEGVYDVIKAVSEKRGQIFRFLNVPGRSGILIHVGNFAAGKKIDTEGCILPGRKFEDRNNDGFIDVVDSAITMNLLLKILPDNFKLYII